MSTRLIFPDSPLERCRFFLKDTVREMVDFASTDQSCGVPPPPIQKPATPDARRVDLPPVPHFREAGLGESVRRFSRTPLTLTELAYLLWTTQGVRRPPGPGPALRTVPSAGNRHALETYLYCRRVASLEEGIYRYLPLDHLLVCERAERDLARHVIAGCRGQTFAGDCAATFIWTAVPYRMEWRYGLAAHKVIAIDAGHVCQNLYLACQAIEAGTCAIAAYDQEAMDALLGLDGKDEFTIYVAPVGKMV
jgi:SagB-type dehydrogenase family enzyme